VQRRSGTLAATHRSPLAQLRDLAALGRAATANRPRIESWKTRPGSDRLVSQDSVSASSDAAPA
jgi:hypothetical protein